VQTVPINGAVVVTTPSEVAMEDARKAVRMFEQVKTPIVGLVENMSYLVGPGGEHIDVFGQGGGRRMAEAMNIPFLVELPLDPKVRIGGDSGAPAALNPLGAGAAFHELATKVNDAMAGLSKKAGPKITLED
jgi:ATP-binding protein involved in chromosome partitioning